MLASRQGRCIRADDAGFGIDRRRRSDIRHSRSCGLRVHVVRGLVIVSWCSDPKCWREECRRRRAETEIKPIKVSWHPPQKPTRKVK